MELPFVIILMITTTSAIKGSKDSDQSTAQETSFSSLDVRTHPRIQENLSQKFSGYEGSHIKGFELKKAFVAVTPGLQTPPHHGKTSSHYHEDDWSGLCDFRKFSQTHRSEKVQNYPEIVLMKERMRRKNERSGFKVLKALPEAGQCKNQQLSSYGVAQLINLGEYLAISYFGKLKALDNVEQNEQLAETVGDETLYQSVSALLYGLLTEKQFVSVDVAKSSADFVQVSTAKNAERSPTHHEDLHYFVQQSFEKENHLLKDTKVGHFTRSRDLEEKLGPEVSAKSVISHLSNKILSHNSDILLDLSWENIDEIFSVSDSHNEYLATNPMFQSYSESRVHSLVQRIKGWLAAGPPVKDSKHRGANDLKLVAIDELFLLGLLTALGVPVSQHMVPSSRLVIELFVFNTPDPNSQGSSHMKNSDIKSSKYIPRYIEVSVEENGKYVGGKQKLKSKFSPSLKQPLSAMPQNSKDQLETKEADDIPRNTLANQYVRIIYNGQVVTSYLPECGDDHLVSLGLCSLSKFQNLFNLRRRDKDEL